MTHSGVWVLGCFFFPLSAACGRSPAAPQAGEGAVMLKASGSRLPVPLGINDLRPPPCSSFLKMRLGKRSRSGVSLGARSARGPCEDDALAGTGLPPRRPGERRGDVPAGPRRFRPSLKPRLLTSGQPLDVANYAHPEMRVPVKAGAVATCGCCWWER